MTRALASSKMILKFFILCFIGFGFSIKASLAKNPQHHQYVKLQKNEDHNASSASKTNADNSTQPHTFVLLGATGDLAKREIYPALWELFRDHLLPANTRIIGLARSKRTIAEIRKNVMPFVSLRPEDQGPFEDFWNLNEYISGSENLNVAYDELNDLLKRRGGNRLFYLALPPSSFAEAAAQLPREGPAGTWTRLVVEKPFGKDSESYRELAEQLGKLFDEHQIYRMDHFLGYEMVQNMMALRFGNRAMEPAWRREHVASVMVDFRENFGIEGRGGYFDENGIIRDVVQNHLLQVVALVAMDRPESGSPDDIRDAKVALLKKVKPIVLNNVVIGQYIGNPESADPRERIGYREDSTVANNSITSTFSLTVLDIDNDRWRGVPFIIRAGKGLERNSTEVIVQYKDVDKDIFDDQTERNEFVVRIGDTQAMQFKVTSKTPGITNHMQPIKFDFDYRKEFHPYDSQDGYVRLILDVFHGSQTNFVRTDELSEAWRIFTPVLHKIEGKKVQPVEYKFGSTGPQQADAMEMKNDFLRKPIK